MTCVTVVVPVRNEEATVAAALESLAQQTIGPERLEVLVYDGLSTDRSAAIAASFAERAPWKRLEVLRNADVTVPRALNLALSESTCPWFTRLDGRTILSPEYLERCIAVAEEASRLLAVGGQLVPLTERLFPSAIADAVTHPLGVGQGFRTPHDNVCEVPHHPFAVWRTDDVRRVGGFNPEFSRNQDDEFSMRARKAGARIVLLPEVHVLYRPRERLRGLATQYFQYGIWKAVVGRRTRLFPLRSLVPVGSAGVAVTAVALALGGATWIPAAAFGASYLGLGAVVARRRLPSRVVLVACALAVVHLSYGLGIVLGALWPGITRTRVAVGRLR